MNATEIVTASRLTHRIEGKQAWTRDTLRQEDWLMKLPPDCLAELRRALIRFRDNRLPMFLLDPADFDLPACRAFMARVKAVVDDGVMFAVVDRLPIEEMSRDEATNLYWLLASLMARPVAQRFDGTMLFDVRDTGAKMVPGSGIRPTVTNVDLTFHNDNSYNETMPEYVTLFCLSQALSGGISRVLSMYSVHNAILERHANLLPRLYEPFFYDRHAEHEKGETPYRSAPVFSYDGTDLTVRIAHREILGGYALRGEPLDEEGRLALDAVKAVFDTPEIRTDLTFEPGQIQFVNNRRTGHARTDFVDGDRPDQKRHLVRLWLRDHGQRGYRGL